MNIINWIRGLFGFGPRSTAHTDNDPYLFDKPKPLEEQLPDWPRYEVPPKRTEEPSKPIAVDGTNEQTGVQATDPKPKKTPAPRKKKPTKLA